MKNRIMTILLLLTMMILPKLAFSQEANTTNVFQQKDGLFKIGILEGWHAEDMPGRVLLLPPAPNGNGIVIQFKENSQAETLEETKARISASVEKIVDYKIQPAGREVIENKEITIDHVYARQLFYRVNLNGELMYFVRTSFVNKGYIFSIDYGAQSKAQVEKMIVWIDTFKF